MVKQLHTQRRSVSCSDWDGNVNVRGLAHGARHWLVNTDVSIIVDTRAKRLVHLLSPVQGLLHQPRKSKPGILLQRKPPLRPFASKFSHPEATIQWHHRHHLNGHSSTRSSGKDKRRGRRVHHNAAYVQCRMFCASRLDTSRPSAIKICPNRTRSEAARRNLPTCFSTAGALGPYTMAGNKLLISASQGGTIPSLCSEPKEDMEGRMSRISRRVHEGQARRSPVECCACVNVGSGTLQHHFLREQARGNFLALTN